VTPALTDGKSRRGERRRERLLWFDQLLVPVVWKAIVHWPGHAALPEAPKATLTLALLPAAFRKSTPTEAHTVHEPEV
jgi:hypothetical protein